MLLSSALQSKPAAGAEIHSNGKGGGNWSDPSSWRGQAMPQAGDDVVISRGDVVVFDRNDNTVALAEAAAAMVGIAHDATLPGKLSVISDLLTGAQGKTTCQKISIDPKGVLTFKTGAGKVTLCAAGLIESYGTIKLDTRNGTNDNLELRLVGATPESRHLQLKKGGALTVLGQANRASGRPNIILNSLAQPAVSNPDTDAEALGVMEGEAGTMMDVQHAELVNILLKATSIDNTGAKPNERMNVAQNRFVERSHVFFTACDTPLIVNNVFDYTGSTPLSFSAINPHGSTLAEVRGNTIKGLYSYAIMGQAMVDSIIAGNTIEKCSNGIYWYGENGMLKQNTIRDCGTGIVVTSMSGALEDITIDGCQFGYNHAGATAQLSNVRITNTRKDGKAIQYATGPLTLLNCNVSPEQVEVLKMERPPPKPAFFVQSMEFLVVGIKGDAPIGTKVEVMTNNPARPLPAGAVDLNIRNAPATFQRNSLTPLPKSGEAMVVRSWLIDGNGRLVPAPEYAVRVVHGARVIHSLNVKPDAKWFRDKPNEPLATVEVNVK